MGWTPILLNDTPASAIAYEGVLLGGNAYLVNSTGGPVTCTALPPLASVNVGTAVTVIDGNNSAGLNNITVPSTSGDLIYDHGASSGDYVLRVSSTCVTFFAQSFGWVAISYGV